jgi:hypothetical protein
MYGLEYAALISDLVFGFSCALLSLLHFFGVGKSFENITGLIGLISGVIGFILTLIYIIYSGYIFTNDGPGKYYGRYFSSVPASSSSISHRSGGVIKLDKERAFAEWDGSKYKCLYYDTDDEDSFYAKYNDFGKKQYNYHKDFEYPDSSSEYNNNGCFVSNFVSPLPRSPLAACKNPITDKDPDCNKLYYSGNSKNDEFYYKYIYDKWVTSIIFGCFIIVLNLGLAGFGFLLFSQTEGSSGHVAVK